MAASFSVCAAFAAFATTTSIDTLVLDQDQVIDVAFGDRYIIDAITGSDAYTLTKTGAGVLQIGYCENPNAKIVVSGGTLEARIPLVPSIAADAFFHVDASLSSTITSTLSQGTNLVSKWTDVRGEGYPNATDIGKNQPYLTANYLNGRTVMDFGSYWGGIADNGCRWGAAMEWSETITNLRELFTVAMDTEDLKFKSPAYSTTAGKRAGVWVGLKVNAASSGFIYRDARTPVEDGEEPSGAQNATILHKSCSWASSARVAIDGETNGYSYDSRYPDGMHVLSLANTANKTAKANTFACERCNAYGGLRMGETLVFTNELSDATRATIETYLKKKWLTGVFSLARLEIGEGCALRLPQGGVVTAGEYLNNGVLEGPGTVAATTTLSSDFNLTADAEITVEAGQTRIIRNLTGGAFTLTKKGEGKLVIEYCNSDAIKVTAEAGTLEIRRNNAPAVLSSAALHVDASLTNGFTVADEEGVSYVTAWPDVRGGSDYPTPSVPDGGKAPFLNVAYANGRTVMDFGTLYNGTYQSGWGATMRFGANIYPVEVFMVAGDNEEAKGCVDGTGGAEHRNNTLFGHTSTSNPIYRGNGATGEACEIIHSDSPFSRAEVLCTLDGESVTATATRLSDGLHVIGYSFTDADYLADPASFGLELDSFASERNKERGGIRIAEYVIFTNAISTAERKLVVDYLTDRWTKPLALGRLEVAAGATLSLPDGDRLLATESVINGTVTGSGTVKSMARNLGTMALKADQWIDVPLGEIVVIDKVTNSYGYAIVKTGLGKLVIADSVNAKARLLVKAGEAVIGKSDRPVAAVLGEINLAEGTSLTVADGSSCEIGLLTDAGGTVAGTLTSGAVANGSGIAVTNGDVVMDPLANATAFFHVDAAKTNSILISDSAPTNVVCWSDVRGRRAKNGSDKPTDAGNFAWTASNSAGYYPNWGGDGFTQNGLPVMDMGNIAYSGDSNTKKRFKWNQGCWTVRDFILVVGDNENIKELEGSKGSVQYRSQAFLGHEANPGGSMGGNPAMGRGNRTQGSASPYLLNLSTLNGGIDFACDGVAVSEPKSDIFPDGMHVVSGTISESKVTSSNAYFNTFAQERNTTYGGQRIGEALIFDHALSDSERAEYTELLLTKWFGSNAVVRTHAAVSVPSNTTLSLPNQALAVTTSLALGGTISAVSVAAPSTITVSCKSEARIRGKLTLPASGTFVLDDSWKTIGGGKRRLIAASDITYADDGSISNWTVTMPVGSRSGCPELSQEPDGIYVTTVCGMMLMLK